MYYRLSIATANVSALLGDLILLLQGNLVGVAIHLLLYLLSEETPLTVFYLTVKEAAKILRIGITSTYELCHQSEYNGFPCIRDGNKIRIPYNLFLKWIEDNATSRVGHANKGTS